MDNNKYSIKKENQILYVTLIVNLLVFIIAITTLIIYFNRLMSEHDQYMSGEICTLVTEKMNSFIDSLTDTSDRVAATVSAQHYTSLDEIYEKLSADDTVRSQYAGIGFVDEDGYIYASEEEILDFDRWNLLACTMTSKDVVMSMPYRSAVYGKTVATIFSRITYAESKKGWFFITYMFEDLQKTAETNSNIIDLEIWLMHAASANIIQCVATDEHAAGSWTNAYLRMQDITDENSKEIYQDWIEQLRNGVNNMGLNYTIGKDRYSQYCDRIESAQDWYVVVRIPSRALSSTMSKFRNGVIAFIISLLFIVVVIILTMYRLNRRENDILEDISIHDALTGLLNRRAFDDSAGKWLESGEYKALCFFDIDHFKEVNDNLGHEKGDELLTAFSGILSDNLGDRAKLFRFGGDEFVAMIAIDDFDEIDQILKQTLNCVHTIKLSEHDEVLGTHMSFSAGLAKYPFDAENIDELIRCADKALYSIKESGRDGYRWYKNLK